MSPMNIMAMPAMAKIVPTSSTRGRSSGGGGAEPGTPS